MPGTIRGVVLTAALALTAACNTADDELGSDEAGVGVGDHRRPGGGGADGADAASTGVDGGPAQPGTGGALIDAALGPTPGTANALPDACVPGPLLAPSASCLPADPTEPSTKAAPARVGVEPGCGLAVGQFSDRDEDSFSFTTRKSEPTRVELSYTAAGTADLRFGLYDTTDSFIKEANSTRTGPTEQMGTVFQSAAGATYRVDVGGTNVKMCQPYVLRVNPTYCTDGYEDNDTEKSPTKLTWSADGKIVVDATSFQGDADYYELTAMKNDAIRLTLSYTAEPDATIELRRAVRDTTGSLISERAGMRSGPSEMHSYWIPARAAGASFQTEISASGSGCAPYQLRFEALACTDKFEDNDTPTTAVPLPLAQDHELFVIASDPDHYAVPALGDGGSCTFRYSVPTGFTSSLRATVRDGAGQLVTERSGGELEGTTRVLKVSWGGGRGAASLVVTGDAGNVCQAYTMRCDPMAATAAP